MAVMTVAAGMAQDGFIITGHFPGVKAGSKIELVNSDMRGNDSWYKIDGTATDGEFVIKGTVDKPTLCEIRVQAPGSESDKAFPLMVENVAMEASAAHIDSVPPGFFAGPVGLYQRKNVTIKGGDAQREFEEYSAYMFPYDVAARQAHYNLYWDENADKTKEGKKKLKDAYDAAGLELSKAEERFINEHPAYHISALRWGQKLSEPFLFTGDELDALWVKLSQNNSPARVAQLKGIVDNARKYVRGQQYSDFTAQTPDGKECRFADVAGKGRYTMVDFWASWCGPCRAAIPHVRELHEKYGDKLGVIAVSVDEDPEAWAKAMGQEKMDWTQLRVAKENFKDVSKAYNFSGIPFMVLIDAEGNIVFAGHDPVKVSEILSQKI